MTQNTRKNLNERLGVFWGKKGKVAGWDWRVRREENEYVRG